MAASSSQNTVLDGPNQDKILESEGTTPTDEKPMEMVVSSLSPVEQLESLPLEPVDIESIRDRRGFLTDSAIFHIMFRIMKDKLHTSPIQLAEPTWLAQWLYDNISRPSETPYFFNPNAGCDKVLAILIPFNIDNIHWTCIYVNLEKKTAVFYDSMMTVSNILLARTIMFAFYETFKDHFQEDKSIPFRFDVARYCEQQRDGSSCGVFTCHFMMDFLNGKDPNDPERQSATNQWDLRHYFCEELDIPLTNPHR